MPNEITSCGMCGSVVTRHRSRIGTSYFIPVKNEYLPSLMDNLTDKDIFIADRLRRAEKIIVELRKELRDHRCP